jgi:hypothetical protein
MNVRGIANQYTQVINKNQKINWIQSNGYVTDNAGKRTPKTLTLTVDAQVQSLGATALQHVDWNNAFCLYVRQCSRRS